jgi:hypothetical protein
VSPESFARAASASSASRARLDVGPALPRRRRVPPHRRSAPGERVMFVPILVGLFILWLLSRRRRRRRVDIYIWEIKKKDDR